MFERFTDPARRVIVLAQKEARELKHGSIGPEHLLLGLLREEQGIGALVLGRLDFSVDDVRDRVTRLTGVGTTIPAGQIPFTPRAKKALELSLREALARGSNRVGTEHILPVWCEKRTA